MRNNYEASEEKSNSKQKTAIPAELKNMIDFEWKMATHTTRRDSNQKHARTTEVLQTKCLGWKW